jgi:endoglucanase
VNTFLRLLRAATAFTLVATWIVGCSSGKSDNATKVLPGPGAIAFATTTATTVQTATAVNVTVSRTGGSSGAASVSYATANGSATATDYTATSGTLNWADGDMADKTITVSLTSTTAYTGIRTFTLTLSGVSGATLGTASTATVSITGSGGAGNVGTLVLSSSTYSVTQSAGTLSVTVNRTGGSTGTASVNYATSNGSALSGTDYTAASGTLNWAANDGAAKPLTVPITSTAAFSGSKTFTVTLSSAAGSTLGTPAAAAVTITGSANPGMLALAASTYSVTQIGGSVMITVNRSGGTFGTAAVTYATSNGTATAGTHYTATTNTLNWASGDGGPKTFVVPVSNTTPFTGSKTFTVTLSSPVGATLGTQVTSTVTITGSAGGTGCAGGSTTVTLDAHITVDQFGYRPNDPKVAVIRNPQVGYDSSDTITPGTNYELRNAADGCFVFSSAITPWNGGTTESSSGDKGWWFDFSSVTTPGTYFVADVTRNVRSPTFKIGQPIYKDILKAATRMYFYQRSGMAKLAQYVGAGWADGTSYDKANQDLAARDVTAQGNPGKDVSGGWFDAGDTNKYVTYAVTPVHQLLMAYQNKPSVFTDDFNIPESGNGIPDVIDEVKYEIDWLKKMQDIYTDGGVALKVGTLQVENASPPSGDTTPRYYVPKCTSSTIAAAGMFAHASYVYNGFASLSTEASDLKNRAINAWNNYQGIATKQTNCDTGAVRAGDADRSGDEQSALAVVAAVYLYAITGDATYHNYVKANFNQNYMRPYFDDGFTRYDPEQGEALLFYTTLSNADAATKTSILTRKQNDVNNVGSKIYGFTANDALYRGYLPDAQHHWGSSQPRGNYGNTNMDVITYNLAGSNDATYRTRALEMLHYFHGVNPFGMVYLSNMSSYGATRSANAIFHAWFRTDSSKWANAATSTFGPAPGYVPGGPNKDTGVSLSPPAGQPPQKSYRDWNGNGVDPQQSWEITEPGIYYQSAYVKLISAFAE